VRLPLCAFVSIGYNNACRRYAGCNSYASSDGKSNNEMWKTLSVDWITESSPTCNSPLPADKGCPIFSLVWIHAKDGRHRHRRYFPFGIFFPFSLKHRCFLSRIVDN
jgi:hypothetical protein